MATGGFSNMADLIADLGRMDREVQDEGASIVRSTAELMQAEVEGAYARHRVTGTLEQRVEIVEGTRATAGPALRWKVRARAPHTHLFEYGTVQRSTAGTGANRGTMPATPTFVPAAVRARARMRRELVGLVQRQRVRGMTGALEVRER